MKKPVSDSELEVLKVLWRTPGLSAPEIVAALQRHCEWEKTTIITLLNRLVGKQCVAREGVRRSYRYRALVTHDECRGEELQNIFRHYFEGKAAALVSYFVRRGELKPEDVAEIRQALAELEEGDHD